MTMSAQFKHKLINLAGQATPPEIHEDFVDDPIIKEFTPFWDKCVYALNAFDERITAIQQDTRYTQEGRQDMMRTAGTEALADLAKIEPYMNRIRAKIEALQPGRSIIKAPDPSDAAAAVRAAEIRTWLRESGNVESTLRKHGGVDAVLIDAAQKGQLEVVSAIVHAPVGMFHVSAKNFALAEDLLAEKTDPGGAKRYRVLKAAFDVIDSLRRGVRAHIARISGVRDPLIPLTARTPEGVVTLEA